MKIRNNQELMGYCCGVRDAWMAFRYAAYNKEITLKDALFEFAGWLDNVLTPFYEKVDRGEITTAEFPQPPILGARVVKDGSKNV